MIKFKIKKNDSVKILAGKDKGKTGKVLRILRADNKVVVDGINIFKKHQRSRKQEGKGQVVDVAMPIHISNVAKTK